MQDAPNAAYVPGGRGLEFEREEGNRSRLQGPERFIFLGDDWDVQSHG